MPTITNGQYTEKRGKIASLENIANRIVHEYHSLKEQEQTGIQLKVQVSIYLVPGYTEMHSIEDFQPGLQQKHLQNGIFNPKIKPIGTYMTSEP